AHHYVARDLARVADDGTDRGRVRVVAHRGIAQRRHERAFLDVDHIRVAIHDRDADAVARPALHRVVDVDLDAAAASRPDALRQDADAAVAGRRHGAIHGHRYIVRHRAAAGARTGGAGEAAIEETAQAAAAADRLRHDADGVGAVDPHLESALDGHRDRAAVAAIDIAGAGRHAAAVRVNRLADIADNAAAATDRLGDN